ncbi:uncharacterized protein [Palaemon carinicauda]|uniref:uncharacterized protein isoform X2 n=1 Tax=Palaemon carinicauda TaxID=392227 RepID=UPI0035B5E846
MRRLAEGIISKVICMYTFISEVMAGPLLGPDVMSFGSLSPLTVWQEATFPLIPALPFHTGLPAPRGTVFDGPDPGLNAAIITVPKESCPNGYRRDINDVCRLKFSYGPNPFFSFTPENFKGDVQFYMGLQVGQSRQLRRKGRGRGRPRPPPAQATSLPPQQTTPTDDDDD